MRTLWCGLLLVAVMAAPAVAQDEDTRPSLPTVYGDTGFWFVPTAEVLPKGKISGSLFLENEHRPQGVTRIVQFGPTFGIGLGRAEVFGSYRGVGVERDHRPIFSASSIYGGVVQEVPFVERGWTGLKGGPLYLGGKVNFLSQSRQDPIALAFRTVVKVPTGSDMVSDGKTNLMFDLIASGEAGPVELSASGGWLYRPQLDEVSTANSTTINFGASFPSRSALRGLVEFHGEMVNNGLNIVLQPNYVTGLFDNSAPPFLNTVDDVGIVRSGLVWQHRSGWFAHGGFSYTLSYASSRIDTVDESGSPWGYDIRIGFHPGVKKYVPPPPPPPPAPVAAAPPPPAPAPPPNRNPEVTIACNPCTVEPGKSINLTATAKDPDSETPIITWTAPSGSFNPSTGNSTTWTAPNQEGTVPLTATARDPRGGTGTATVQAQVVRPPQKTFMFEDVHFDFDKYNLKPEALKILDEAVSTLQQNPEVRLTLEGHCDSIGTNEYNLALGERRATAARDYLVSRGIATSRLETISYGEERPKADNSTAEGRAMNRRAALVVKIQ